MKQEGRNIKFKTELKFIIHLFFINFPEIDYPDQITIVNFYLKMQQIQLQRQQEQISGVLWQKIWKNR